MYSFRTLYVPQCRRCGTAAPDPDAPGREMLVAQTLLPVRVRAGLTDAGWQVDPGDPRDGLADPAYGDDLTCPACQAAAHAAARDRHAGLHQPPVREVDMSARFGPGWTLRQRDGDADAQQWLVAHRGEIKGMVRRYRRTDGGWSRGWEALPVTPHGFTRLPSTVAGSWNGRSSFLWRSRDLAAWGIATTPPGDEPNPGWARRLRS
jgi:hypothetical protein